MPGPGVPSRRVAVIEPVLEGVHDSTDGRTEHTGHADPGPRASERIQPTAKAPTMTTSHPLFGPCVPSSRSLPILVHVRTHRAPRQATAMDAIHSSRVPAPRGLRLPSAMHDDANTGAWKRGRRGLAVAALVAAAVRPRVPAGTGDHAETELAASASPRSHRLGRRRPRGRSERAAACAARRGTSIAWSTAATIEPWVEVHLLPRIFEDVSGGASRSILMFGWQGRAPVGMQARRSGAEDRGGGRGACHRRRLWLQASRRGQGDVHATRSLRRADRRQRRVSAGQETVSIPTTCTWTGARTRWVAPTTASCT